MTEFKNTEHELKLFRLRLFAVAMLVLVCFSLLMARFVWLQIVRHDAYAAQAEKTAFRWCPSCPTAV